jgi:5'-deoxynucleotidase YfbR-like HD superfamily hydrolase
MGAVGEGGLLHAAVERQESVIGHFAVTQIAHGWAGRLASLPASSDPARRQECQHAQAQINGPDPRA